MNKIKKLFSSVRFQQLLIVLVLQALVVLNIITSEQGTQLINLISAFLGSSVLIGTVDRSVDAKATNTTVSMPSTVTSVSATTKKKK